jgi:hypothetical protein
MPAEPPQDLKGGGRKENAMKLSLLDATPPTIPQPTCGIFDVDSLESE